MRAIEFFKAMGAKSVKQFLENDNIRTKEMHDNLKRLIESHELVESLVHVYGSIDVVKEKASYCGCNECKSRLQAIADVESCL